MLLVLKSNKMEMVFEAMRLIFSKFELGLSLLSILRAAAKQAGKNFVVGAGGVSKFIE